MQYSINARLCLQSIILYERVKKCRPLICFVGLQNFWVSIVLRNMAPSA